MKKPIFAVINGKIFENPSVSFYFERAKERAEKARKYARMLRLNEKGYYTTDSKEKKDYSNEVKTLFWDIFEQ